MLEQELILRLCKPELCILHAQLAGEPLPWISFQTVSVLSSSTLLSHSASSGGRTGGAMFQGRHPHHLLVSSIPSLQRNASYRWTSQLGTIPHL